MAEVLAKYEGLTAEDIRACFLFATKSLRETEIVPLIEQAA
jgi:uncharacterized protein (DUF433 family)